MVCYSVNVEVLNEINFLAEWDKRNKDEDYPIR
jgi:hypothetical protein